MYAAGHYLNVKTVCHNPDNNLETLALIKPENSGDKMKLILPSISIEFAIGFLIPVTAFSYSLTARLLSTLYSLTTH